MYGLQLELEGYLSFFNDTPFTFLVLSSVSQSSFAIILKRKRKLVALLLLYYRFIVTINVLWLFLMVRLVNPESICKNATENVFCLNHRLHIFANIIV